MLIGANWYNWNMLNLFGTIWDHLGQFWKTWEQDEDDCSSLVSLEMLGYHFSILFLTMSLRKMLIHDGHLKMLEAGNSRGWASIGSAF